MAKPKKVEEESGGEGAPLWIISFADMMSLLMAFFVMLSTFSNFGPKEEQQLKGVLKAALAPYGGWLSKPPKTGFSNSPRVKGQTPQGSEKPTMEQTFSTDTMAETGPRDFRTHKTFLIDSSKVFWSTGTTLTRPGKDYLNLMLSYLTKIPSRIVISESGPGSEPDLGINRAIVVAEYFNTNGLSREYCSVAANTMTPPDKERPAARTLEISILDESTYR
jgi:chemotaxis protein MotB